MRKFWKRPYQRGPAMLSRKGRRSASRRTRQNSRLQLEQLETRITPSLLPNPIVPVGSDANLIQQALTKAQKGQTDVLNSFPIPFAIEFSGGSAPTRRRRIWSWPLTSSG